MSEIIPTAVIRPHPTPATRPPSPGIDPINPLVRSVGEIAGLSPRRTKDAGGEVPAADVDTVDALPDPTWSVAAAWLKDFTAVTTRRGYLADLAAFIRWMDAELPGTDLLAVTYDHLTHYRDAMATGGTGRPLAASTVARRLSSLSSLYEYAVFRGALDRNPADRVRRPKVSTKGTTPARTRQEQAALVAGARHIADQYPVDAAAVLLMAVCALRVSELISLTAGSVVRDAGHCVLHVRRKGGKGDRVVAPPMVCELLDPLCEGKAADDLVFAREDGRPWDRWRATTAMRRAARAGDVDPKRLTPHTNRATAATALRKDGVPLEDVQEFLGHASPLTTRRYDRGEDKLDKHAAYRMAALLAEEES